jgi:hypothetical protein
MAPTNGDDTRIEVLGPEADVTCQSILSTLGAANWTISMTAETESISASLLPSDDTNSVCNGVIEGDQYRVMDHEYLHGYGTSTCATLEANYS